MLLVAGWYLEWGPGKEKGAPWGRTLLGIGLAYVGFVGMLQLVDVNRWTGGRIGRFLTDLLAPLLTGPGAFVVLTVLLLAGLLIAFDRPLRAMLAPATNLARAAGTTLQDRTIKAVTTEGPASKANGKQPTAQRGADVATGPAPSEGGRRGRAARIAAVDAPGQTGVWGSDDGMNDIPVAMPTMGPASATIAPLRVAGAALAEPGPVRPPDRASCSRSRRRHRRSRLAAGPRGHRMDLAAPRAARSR